MCIEGKGEEMYCKSSHCFLQSHILSVGGSKITMQQLREGEVSLASFTIFPNTANVL